MKIKYITLIFFSLTIFSGTENSVQSRLKGSIEFCLGFSIVFISLAAIASSVGSFFTRNSYKIDFKINGELENIEKLPAKINSLPIVVNKSILYIDNDNKLALNL